MGIAITLKEYLREAGVDYELVKHAPTLDSIQTAIITHVSGKKLAKAVMLEDTDGRYLLAIIPANKYIDLEKINRQFNIELELAAEHELSDVFDDCEPGAIPVIGEAYGVAVMLDESLTECSDIYFEGGDHMHLVHLNRQDFSRLMAPAIHARFTMP